MKNLISVLLSISFIVTSNSIFAVEKPSPQNRPGVLKQKIEATEIIFAATSIAAELLKDIPTLIKDIPAFPSKVESTFKEIEKGYLEAAKIKDQKERDKKIQELFVVGVKLLVEVNNIIDNFLGIVKTIGPLVTAIDKQTGPKVEAAIHDVAQIIYMITKIAVAQQGVITRENPAIKKPAEQATVNLPDL